MIGRIEGQVVDRGVDGVIVVDVGGVGYELHVPLGTLGKLPERAVLHVHTHVREDQLTLFGFATQEDRFAFRALLGVSNVGPKLAMSVLSALDARELARAVAAQDRSRFKGISGVGAKTVERILLDLKDKLPVVAPASSPGTTAAPSKRAPAANDTVTLVVQALVQMGYRLAEAERAVALLDDVESKKVEVLLREALGKLA